MQQLRHHTSAGRRDPIVAHRSVCALPQVVTGRNRHLHSERASIGENDRGCRRAVLSPPLEVLLKDECIERGCEFARCIQFVWRSTRRQLHAAQFAVATPRNEHRRGVQVAVPVASTRPAQDTPGEDLRNARIPQQRDVQLQPGALKLEDVAHHCSIPVNRHLWESWTDTLEPQAPSIFDNLDGRIVAAIGTRIQATAMNTVLSVILRLLLTVVFGLGVFLSVVADEMPAPGLLLILISVIFAIRFWFRRPGVLRSVEQSAFDVTEIDRQSYELEAERRRKGDSDSTQGHPSGFV
jgi:hypothetical protein